MGKNKSHKGLRLIGTRFKFLWFICLFALAGTVLVFVSRAAIPTASIESENGIVNSPATAVSDGLASGGQAVQFKAAAGGGTRACPAFPAFPDANCTGITPGTSMLTVNGSVTISQPGTVYAAKEVKGVIYVEADNVTIRNVKAWNGLVIRGSGTTIEDTEMGPPVGSGGDEGIAVSSGNYICRRCNIHSFSDGGKLAGVSTIEDSYIHDLWGKDGDHNDGLQDAYKGSGTIILRHNSISSVTSNGLGGQNGAIQVADGWDGTVTLENNLFDSGGVYAVRLHENGRYYVRNNRWTRRAENTHVLINGIILEWAGNAFQDNGQVINR